MLPRHDTVVPEGEVPELVRECPVLPEPVPGLGLGLGKNDDRPCLHVEGVRRADRVEPDDVDVDPGQIVDEVPHEIRAEQTPHRFDILGERGRVGRIAGLRVGEADVRKRCLIGFGTVDPAKAPTNEPAPGTAQLAPRA